MKRLLQDVVLWLMDRNERWHAHARAVTEDWLERAYLRVR